MHLFLNRERAQEDQHLFMSSTLLGSLLCMLRYKHADNHHWAGYQLITGRSEVVLIQTPSHLKTRCWGTSADRCRWSRRTWERRGRPEGSPSAPTWWCLRSGAAGPIAPACPRERTTGGFSRWGFGRWCIEQTDIANRGRAENKLTVNSPVTASKPTWMVCSKSEGGEISGRSLSLSFFLPPEIFCAFIYFVQAVKVNPSFHQMFFACVLRGTLAHEGHVFLTRLTFLSTGKDWDDLIARFLLLGNRGERFGAVVAWERVFAGACAENGAAHSDWRCWGFVFWVTVVTHGQGGSRTTAKQQARRQSHQWCGKRL